MPQVVKPAYTKVLSGLETVQDCSNWVFTHAVKGSGTFCCASVLAIRFDVILPHSLLYVLAAAYSLQK